MEAAECYFNREDVDDVVIEVLCLLSSRDLSAMACTNKHTSEIIRDRVWKMKIVREMGNDFISHRKKYLALREGLRYEETNLWTMKISCAIGALDYESAIDYLSFSTGVLMSCSEATNFLYLAILHAQPPQALLDVLIARGADVNDPVRKPLELASLSSDLQTMEYLVDCGANITDDIILEVVCYERNDAAVLWLIEHGGNVNANEYDESVLSSACRWCEYDTVLRLLELGADVSYGEYKAIACAADYGRLDIVELLYDRSNKQDERLKSGIAVALNIAANRNMTNVFKFLLGCVGRDTWLDYAYGVVSINGSVECLRLLISVHPPSDLDTTFVMLLMSWKANPKPQHRECAQLLVDSMLVCRRRRWTTKLRCGVILILFISKIFLWPMAQYHTDSEWIL